MTPGGERVFLRSLFDVAIAAAAPARVVPPHLPPAPKGQTIVLGAGKASAAMARAVEDNWSGPLSGLVVTRYGHAVPCRRIEIVEAAHPVPDQRGERAALRILELAASAGPDDLVLCLISGGGSALLALPAAGITLADKQAVNRALLTSGADIAAMNTVRKHLSAIKGGRLAAAAWPAELVALAISDVPGDDLSIIASGPTVADPSTFADARAILARYAITPPPAVAARLAEAIDETPKPGDERLHHARTTIIASPLASLEAAAAVARDAGVTPLILGDALEGEARELGRVLAGIALSVSRHGQPISPAGGAALRRRDDGHRPRQGRQGRPQCRGPRRPRHRAQWGAGHLRARRRYRRHRRQPGQCRRRRDAGHARPFACAWPRCARGACGQRLLVVVRRPRRPGDDRADAHQRQRLPRRAGDLEHRPRLPVICAAAAKPIGMVWFTHGRGAPQGRDDPC